MIPTTRSEADARIREIDARLAGVLFHTLLNQDPRANDLLRDHYKARRAWSNYKWDGDMYQGGGYILVEKADDYWALGNLGHCSCYGPLDDGFDCKPQKLRWYPSRDLLYNDISPELRAGAQVLFDRQAADDAGRKELVKERAALKQKFFPDVPIPNHAPSSMTFAPDVYDGLEHFRETGK